MTDKMIFGMFAISIVAILQIVAWIMGFNGQVFAFTSLCIGAIAGSLLGFNFGKRKTDILEIKDNRKAILPVKK